MNFLLVTTKGGICHPLGLTLDTAVDIGGGYTGTQSRRRSLPREKTQPTSLAVICHCPDFGVDNVFESNGIRLLTYESIAHYSTTWNTYNVGSSSLGDVMMRSINYDNNL